MRGIGGWIANIRHARQPTDHGASSGVLLRNLIDETVAEAAAMADYALSCGDEVPAPLLESLQVIADDQDTRPPAERSESPSAAQAARIGELARVHHGLTRIVHPANPRSILLLSRERHRPLWIRLFGPVPLIRGLIVAALIFVAAWIGLSLTGAADGTVDWQSEHGIDLLIEELHLLAAAGVGAAFASLFLAIRYVTRGTYDPTYASSYWIRLVLGVVAGMILALLVPLQGDALGNIGTPVLAMVGGFSVGVVYRILKHLASTVESLVGVDPDARTSAAAERSRTREEVIQERIRLGKEMMEVRDLLGSGNEAEGLDRLDRTISNLVGPGIGSSSHARR